MSGTSRPNVLIVGGLTSVSRQFAQSLFPPNGPPLVEYLRIVDKYMVQPPTTYVGPDFPRLVNRPDVEYSQNNLTMPERLPTVFDPPSNGRPWDLVFDFLGEVVFDTSERTQILQTYRASVNCGIEAARRGTVKAYVRLTWGFYHCTWDRLHTEDEMLEPDGVRGLWWHETLRSLAAIPNLPLVIIRAGIPYGPYCSFGVVAQRILIGEIYRYKKRTMRYLWSPQLRLNTVHTDDISGACWKVAMWIATVGRNTAIAQAGVAMYFANDEERFPPGLPGVVPPDEAPRAAFFNLTDGSDSTQMSVGTAIASVFGISLGFRKVPSDADIEILAGTVNTWHGEVWWNLCQRNNPPIEYPPMHTYVEPHDLTDQASAWDGRKFNHIVRYTYKRPQLTAQAIAEIVSLWKREGSFPVVNAVDPSLSSDEEDDDDEEEHDDEDEAAE
ncbi:hypothetical protein DACRYDRAFT_24484 [Dacryopinax primogenitus]|uniref:Uncharacterized protein n=1 Tax=Dacryopinax primogenitus (strain DJM 731) TaxID=1858805 RepID=M5FXY2_DACPD|nr:uncharacterized protein DACRYDRAFT_24484 [Dacryopinax primogenitus]EJT98406.1 hypothetical protein DACRYDRAFT_24484 [Dacryopinax primogenitus]